MSVDAVVGVWTTDARTRWLVARDTIRSYWDSEVADAAISPTQWQASTFPEPFRSKITVVHDGIDTDALAPGQYMKYGIEEIARHCLESLQPEFASQVRAGDVVVAGRN